jgi:UDP:flavonoid glycosyltransferase YjiC (YdhE family)
MRVGIQVWGSDGDIRPMIALASGLKQSGHHVTIMIASVDNKSYAGLCAKTGITMLKKPDRIEVSASGLASNKGRLPKSSDILFKMLDEGLYPYVNELYDGSKYLCERNDIVIGHFSSYYLKIAAKKKGIPYINISFWPGFIPSDTEPPPGILNLGPAAVKMSWPLYLSAFNNQHKDRVNELFTAEGMPPVKHVITEGWLSDEFNLVACSKIFFQEPKDWTASGKIKITGFLNMPDHAEHYQFPPNLKEFLTRRGDDPVFMTLGSSMLIDPDRGMFMLIEAARAYKHRVIIQTASKKYPADSFLQNIYFSEKMPHRDIIHFCSAVVHHCGAGTVQTVAMSGVPSVPLYFTKEQRSWADKIYGAGISSKPLDYMRFTPEELAVNIRAAALSVSMKDAAVKCGMELKKEDGVGESVKAIESFIASLK